jgi:NADPH-dependent curcumin reductase CurA
LTVIGFAGSQEKCDWLTKELKFDFAFNYKKVSIDDALKKAAPKGADIFFDNVSFIIKFEIFQI